MRPFLIIVLILVCSIGCATTRPTSSPTEEPVVSPAQLVSNPQVTVHDEPGTASVFYASDTVREGDASWVAWKWQSAKTRKTGECMHGVFWTHSYVAREPHTYQSATLADGSSATLVPDEIYDGRHIASTCDASTCRISESWVVFFDEEDVKAARTGRLAFTMQAKDGTRTTTKIPGTLIDAVLRNMDQP